MNTNRDVLSGSDLEKPISPAMPSGCEVESATFHAPVRAVVVTPAGSEHSGGTRGKLDSLKAQVMPKLHDVQHSMQHKIHDLQHSMHHKMHDVQQLINEKSAVMKSNVATTKTDLQHRMTHAQYALRTGMNDTMTKMNSSMRTSPAKWAGIAAGSGMVIGLIGRFAQWRSKRRREQLRHMPQLVVIEASC